MSVRRAPVVAIAALWSLAATAQEPPGLDFISNWSAPPFWSFSDKPAKETPETAGSFAADVADVVPSPPMPFVAINPCRIADTRGAGFSGQAGPPALSVGVARVFQIGGTVAGVPTQCGIPLTAQAVSFQFSATGMNSAGNLIAWPDGVPPTTSVLNWNTDSVAIGNGIVVPLNATGGVSVQLNGLAGAVTHLIVDVNGYYAPAGIVNTLNGLSGAVTLAQGTNITITPSGQNLTIAAAGGAAGWSLTGNAGTNPTTNFLGTTDNQRLEIKVNSQRVFRLEPNATSPNLIGGHSANSVTATAFGGTVAGGGETGFPNTVGDHYGVVGGGKNNRAGDAVGLVSDRTAATVAGGENNSATGAWAAVGGGFGNTASTTRATIGGGSQNDVTDDYGTVAGGKDNQAGDAAGTAFDAQYGSVGGGNLNFALGTAATVPGGENNTASGDWAFAAGRRAKANHNGSFVWADSLDTDFLSAADNRFHVRARGGFFFHVDGSENIVQNAGSSGGTRLLNLNSANPTAVLELAKHATSAANFLVCTNLVTPAQKCHIDSTGAFVAGSDFAEALPVKGGKLGYEPGDVLVISRGAGGSVEKSSSRYDRSAIGVYSTRPGFVGADKNGDTRMDPDDVPVAITGIVPTKVTAENGPIDAGDLLTTSSTPGHAMKAKPVSVAGVEIYPTGTILGKALEPLAGERGVIRVLVMAR